MFELRVKFSIATVLEITLYNINPLLVAVEAYQKGLRYRLNQCASHHPELRTLPTEIKIKWLTAELKSMHQ
jgi:hypothetical protein